MFKPRGSVIQFNWQDSQEGREYFAGILRRNRRKVFGLLEMPSLPMQSPPDILNYKILLSGKAGIGKTSTIAKLSGQEIPRTHIETPGIQTSVIYWPVKLINSSKVVIFRFQFWDCGDHVKKKYDHLLPACKSKTDAVIFLFSFTDRSSFDELPNQINHLLEPNENVLTLALATRFDQFLHSDITEQELREFEEQWSIPVLKIANVDGPRLSDGRSLDGRAGIMEIAPILNTLAELLWQHDQVMHAGRVSRQSSGSSHHSAERRIR
ncbi:ciliogenesis and planar polarity effector 2-like [Actinia tenebrosa]|uniref:Ciliogenesis and planar polarity effector 2 n=1 Tax=Actinia tenebrosa TaxID=6105 RepID=A0A6P8IBN7_ACTTE|nr:ciliogenesis and planar polarity effector 2-like [Actinia tenebrosa]